MSKAKPEWKAATLGDYVDIQTGYPFKSTEYESCGIKLLRGDNIVQGRLRWDGVKRWPEDHNSDLERYFLRAGDVVLAMDRPWIEAGLKYACIKEHDLPCLLVQRVARIRGINGLLTDYVRFVIGHHSFTDYVKGIWTGVAVPHISESQIRAFQFRLPPTGLQKRIVSILSAYDDLIDNNTRRIMILERLAQMIYREWFVNFRFPGHENVEMVESEIGLIPRGWVVEPLERTVSVLETGDRPKGGIASFSAGVPSIGAESISGVGRFDFAKTRFVPLEYFQKMKKGVLQDRDVLVYKDGGQPGNFHPHVSLVGDGFPFSTMAINSHVYRLRVTDRITQDYLYYHLSSDESLKWMHLHGTGSAIPGLARKDLSCSAPL